LAGYEGQFENFAKWIAKRAPDCKRLNEVTVKHATDFAAHVEKGRSPSTFNQYMNTLDLVWRTLATGARITDNPWRPDRITRKRASTNGAKGIPGRRELALPELKAIIDHASGEYRTLLAIGLYTGLRLGDAVRLDWAEIDLRRGVIVTVPRKTSRTSGSTVAIPISGAFRRELEALGPLASGPVLPGLAKSYERDRSTVTVGVLDLFERAGVKTSVAVPGRKRAVMIAGFHSLRHSFITNAALLGWPEALVRSIVGHTSGAVTRRYIHLGVAAVKSLPAMPDPLALPAATELRRDPLPDWAREILEKSTAKTWRRDRAALLEG
jgi:integrase